MKNEICVLKDQVKKNSISKNSTSSKEKIDENSVLKERVKDLETSLFRCVNGKEKLDVILEKQKCSLDKAGIGFNPFNKKKISKIRFVSFTRNS